MRTWHWQQESVGEERKRKLCKETIRNTSKKKRLIEADFQKHQQEKTTSRNQLSVTPGRKTASRNQLSVTPARKNCISESTFRNTNKKKLQLEINFQKHRQEKAAARNQLSETPAKKDYGRFCPPARPSKKRVRAG